MTDETWSLKRLAWAFGVAKKDSPEEAAAAAELLRAVAERASETATATVLPTCKHERTVRWGRMSWDTLWCRDCGAIRTYTGRDSGWVQPLESGGTGYLPEEVETVNVCTTCERLQSWVSESCGEFGCTGTCERFFQTPLGREPFKEP